MERSTRLQLDGGPILLRMAIIKFGGLVSGARGTIGGLVYSSGGGGPYVRSWARGSNPRTATQSRQRSRVSWMPERWRALTDTQRDDWNIFGADPAQEQINALGEPYYINGFGWFVKINTRLLRAGFSPLDDPPTDTVPAVPTIDSFTFEEVATVFTCSISYDPAEFPSGVGIIIFGACVPRGGRQVQYPGYFMLINSIASPTGDYDFAPEWAAKFAVPQVGDRAFLKIYAQTDQGMRSGPFGIFTSYS
jgi:hypothetical protein